MLRRREIQMQRAEVFHTSSQGLILWEHEATFCTRSFGIYVAGQDLMFQLRSFTIIGEAPASTVLETLKRTIYINLYPFNR